ncbi:Diphthamide synthesis DPH1/DPH2 [Dillenia turbinata]|uniref:Diphthamide synthesis DPH1/DPH2 n=1 Tax=Dillenia turbinata TaxID=194707 RepID=A0AAN8VKK3_9MAGN
MYSLHLSNFFTSFVVINHCFVLDDVTYGTCLINDFSTSARGTNLLIHYAHSYLVPIDATQIPYLYVFVEIKVNVNSLIETIKLNFGDSVYLNRIVLARTIQFSTAIWVTKPELERAGFRVFTPHVEPLSASEVGIGKPVPKPGRFCADLDVVLGFHGVT